MQKVTRCNGTVAGLDVVDAMLFYPSEVRFPLIHQCLLITPAKAFRKGKTLQPEAFAMSWLKHYKAEDSTNTVHSPS